VHARLTSEDHPLLNRLIAIPWYGLAAVTGIAAAQPPALNYDSSYAAYRSFRDEPLASWRQANDEARRTGGHPGEHGAGMQGAPVAPASPEARGEKPQSPATAPSPARVQH
jgi:hypothetical protein